MAALIGAKGEMDRGQSIDCGKGIVSGAACLEQEAVAGWKNPHPLPGNPPANSRRTENAEQQTGQKEIGNEIEEKQNPISVEEEEKRRREPFDAAGAIVHAVIRRVNPMPFPFAQP